MDLNLSSKKSLKSIDFLNNFRDVYGKEPILVSNLSDLNYSVKFINFKNNLKEKVEFVDEFSALGVLLGKNTKKLESIVPDFSNIFETPKLDELKYDILTNYSYLISKNYGEENNYDFEESQELTPTDLFPVKLEERILETPILPISYENNFDKQRLNYFIRDNKTNSLESIMYQKPTYYARNNNFGRRY